MIQGIEPHPEISGFKNGHVLHPDASLKGERAEIKIAYIGGGSREWAPKLMADLALSGRLSGQLDLYDIDAEAAERNARLSEAIFSHRDAQAAFCVVARQTLAETLRGADFVVISIEPGPIENRYADLELPAKYGILQTVGDTTGPGGLLRALRAVPIFRQLAQEIMTYCPKAWVINYTNPMALCTAALLAEAPTLRAFGCCHEVFGTQKMLAEQVVERRFGIRPERSEIELDLAGVNHFTWATAARWNGYDLFPEIADLISGEAFFSPRTEKARRARDEERWFDSSGLIAYDLFRRFGALGAAGDRHLAEFVPWYLTSEDELHRWDVVITPYAWRVRRMRADGPAPTVPARLEASGEEGVQQMEALLGFRPLVTNVNLPNVGQLPGAPNGAIVESYAAFRKNSIRPLVSGALPLGAANWVQRALNEQTLVLQAALAADKDLALQALLSHPLVRLSTDRAWSLLTEMLEATAPMLPQWK